MDLLGLIMPFVIIFCLSTISFYRSRHALTRDRAVETLLTWSIVVGIGLGGLVGFIGHTYMADQTAERIGWAIGSPFQREVAFANLGFGILGLLSFRIRDNFRLATIIGFSVFMIGAAYGHIMEMTARGDYAEYNAGPVLYVDILLPVIILALWMALWQLRRGTKIPK